MEETGSMAMDKLLTGILCLAGESECLIKLIEDFSIFIIPLAHKLKQLKKKLALVINSDLFDFLESYF